ncbi:uncharacterized protein [Aristolochia californica]|uniref:uncharacterized protein n=1 Tax=Aristolochia californica TaxID=171875 RepID=UPI0035D718CA
METLRSLQDKCNISPQAAVLVFVCAVIVVVGLCATSMLRKKRASGEQIVGEGSTGVTEEKFLVQRISACGAVKRALIGSMRWSRGSKWEESERERETLREIALLELHAESGGRFGSTLSPLWQRRILMGERCELPRFSGLILYDERGRPLHSSGDAAHQEKAAPVVTTLRDLLR